MILSLLCRDGIAIRHPFRGFLLNETSRSFGSFRLRVRSFGLEDEPGTAFITCASLAVREVSELLGPFRKSYLYRHCIRS